VHQDMCDPPDIVEDPGAVTASSVGSFTQATIIDPNIIATPGTLNFGP
jgi:hypothetical protein